MEKTIEQIKQDVRVRMDLNSTATKLISIGDEATLTIDAIIESKILEGVKLVEMNAPLELLDNAKSMEGVTPIDILWEARTHHVGGKVLLPEDYMRLYSFKMADWVYAIHEPIAAEGEEYAKQKSMYGGVRGNWQRPVVAIVPFGRGLVLEFYSCYDQSSTVEEAYYIPEPKEVNGKVDIPEKIYTSVVYQIARLVEVTLDEAEKAGNMDTVSDEFVQGESEPEATLAQ